MILDNFWELHWIQAKVFVVEKQTQAESATRLTKQKRGLLLKVDFDRYLLGSF